MLTQVLFRPEIKEIPGGRELIRHEMQKLGRMSRGEMRVLVIFVLAAAAWIGVPLIWGKEASISDAGIAIAVGVLLFLMPAGAKKGVRLLDWDTAVKLPWGVLLLFGGGLALSGQFTSSGLTEWIGQKAAGLEGIPVVLIVALVACLVLFLTELTSNTATAATFLPVAGGVAMGMGLEPMLLAIPVALAATCLHAAGGNPAERHCLWFRLRQDWRDDQGRSRTKYHRHLPHYPYGVSAGSAYLRPLHLGT